MVASELMLLLVSLGAFGSWPEGERKAMFSAFSTENELTCPESGARFRYPGMCNKYVTCKGFQPYVRSCPPGMSFDQHYGHCRLDFDVDCDDASTTPLPCEKNEVYTSCGSTCERTCQDLHTTTDCGYQCVEMCQCRMGYVRETEGGGCIKPTACENANSLGNIIGVY